MPLPSLFGRPPSSVEPVDDDDGPRPPQDYPFPTWQDDGPFYVPAELREDYATARVDPGLIRGFHAGGSMRFPVGDGKIKAIRMMGDKPAAPPDQARELGPNDFPLWLHEHRLIQAQKMAKSRETTAMLDAMNRPSMACPACGTLIAPRSQTSKWVRGFGHVRGCGECVETLAFLVGAELVARHEALEVLQAHARELVSIKLDSAELEAVENGA
jgi:hypothetical protein